MIYGNESLYCVLIIVLGVESREVIFLFLIWNKEIIWIFKVCFLGWNFFSKVKFVFNSEYYLGIKCLYIWFNGIYFVFKIFNYKIILE